MRSEQLNLAGYDTDKIQHHYLEVYDPVLSFWTDKDVKLLEIGVHKGGSLQLWRDYFPKGTIVGIDLELPPEFIPGDRIQLFKGSQADTQFLSQVATSIAPEGFDIIIDDASHIGELSKTTFWHLFHHHLKPGGLYAIEDWGTGYFDDFPDGKKFDPKPSTLDPFGRKEQFRLSKFESLLITEGVVLITKMASSLSASPNPVPAGEGPGQTTVSWNSMDGKVYVSTNGREELLFAGSPRGSQQANWIEADSTHEFRLYNADHKQLLAKVTVTRDRRRNHC